MVVKPKPSPQIRWGKATNISKSNGESIDRMEATIENNSIDLIKTFRMVTCLGKSLIPIVLTVFGKAWRAFSTVRHAMQPSSAHSPLS